MMTTDDLLARLAAARADHPGPALLAVDGDGTLWRPDVAHHYVGWHFTRRSTRPEALPPLDALARAHGVGTAAPDGRPDAHQRLADVITAYEARALAPGAAFASGALMLAGTPEIDALDEAERALQALPAFEAFAGWRPVLAWAERAAVEVWVVSAGPWPMAVRAAARHGIPAARVVAARTVAIGGRFTGALDGPVPYGADKVRALDRAAGGRAPLAAFGDDLADLPLLRAAHLGVAVRPSAALRAAAPDLPSWDPA